MKVLIADDDASFVRVLKIALQGRGHLVVTAQDAMQAVMFVRQDVPDLVLLDINMPGGGGLQALKRIKASTKTADIPIVVCTAAQDAELRATVMGLGATNFLAKPQST